MYISFTWNDNHNKINNISLLLDANGLDNVLLRVLGVGDRGGEVGGLGVCRGSGAASVDFAERVVVPERICPSVVSIAAHGIAYAGCRVGDALAKVALDTEGVHVGLGGVRDHRGGGARQVEGIHKAMNVGRGALLI